jgi:hypothetical protein
VVEAAGAGGHRSLTDLDILAFRFPYVGHRTGGAGSPKAVDAEIASLDPALGRSEELSDMLVGEVKEGAARLNAAARDPAVVRAGLIRFGCCTPEEAPGVVTDLVRTGRATTAAGHQIRMVVFASRVEEEPAGYTVIPLGHVARFLQDHLGRHWEVVRHVQTKEPVLGFLLTLEKALRGTREIEARHPVGP